VRISVVEKKTSLFVLYAPGNDPSRLFFHVRNKATQRCAQRFGDSGHVHQSNIARSPL
jgi:hypothetical protein